MDQSAQHFNLRLELYQWELNTLMGRERFAKGFSYPRVLDSLADTVLRRTEAGCCLPDSILVKKMLNDLESSAFTTKNRIFTHPDVVETDGAVIRGHIKGPKHFFDPDTGR